METPRGLYVCVCVCARARARGYSPEFICRYMDIFWDLKSKLVKVVSKPV